MRHDSGPDLCGEEQSGVWSRPEQRRSLREPRIKTFQTAAGKADWKTSRDFFLIVTDSAEADAYPIGATAFVLMEKQPHNPEGARVAREFFRWSLENGQQTAESLNYVPLPPDLIQQIESYGRESFGG